MESQYQQFGSSDGSSVQTHHSMMAQKGLRRIVVYVLYGAVVLLLLILLLVTGIKSSHLHKEILDVKVLLERNSQRSTASCKEGWVSFQSSCYLLSPITASWNNADEQCRTHGAHLLVLNNEEELDYISEVTEVGSSYWIGLVERENEGHWSWVDGTDLTSTPMFWDEGQPDDWDYRLNGEDCGQIHGAKIRKRRLLNDADCKMKFKYICESRA